MSARILTGLRAKTVDSASSTPEPIILRVQAPAILPNDLQRDLEGCLIVAHGYGDLSSERIEARLVSLNCLDRTGQLIIEEEIIGIIIDRDGVKGLAATPVSRMGVNLARIALAAVISGVSDSLTADSEVVSVSSLGQIKSSDPGKLPQASIGKAFSSASDAYSEIIADLVRQQAPVLEMGSGKEVTVVLTKGVWLKIRPYRVRKEHGLAKRVLSES